MRSIDMSELIGEKLKQARQGAHIKQKDMAQRLGIAPNTLSNYENGRLRISGDYLSKYAIECGITVDKLLGMDRQDQINQDQADISLELHKAVLEANDLFIQLSPEKQQSALDFLKLLSKL
jgi:transcriptional regulator with XRE-family HTH domain